MPKSKLQEFVKGHETFQNIKFKQNKERFLSLVEMGQNPSALFIGCSDSRIVPTLITDSKPGELFIIRNIGNFVAPFQPDAEFHATAAAIEYATSVLEVTDIIVCGHSDCGAIGALFKKIEPSEENIHTIKWLELGEEPKRNAMMLFPDAAEDVLQSYTEKLSVVFQLDNLLTYPAVKKRVDKGKLFLHGWYYEMREGSIYAYDDENYTFLPLRETI